MASRPRARHRRGSAGARLPGRHRVAVLLRQRGQRLDGLRIPVAGIGRDARLGSVAAGAALRGDRAWRSPAARVPAGLRRRGARAVDGARNGPVARGRLRLRGAHARRHGGQDGHHVLREREPGRSQSPRGAHRPAYGPWQPAKPAARARGRAAVGERSGAVGPGDVRSERIQALQRHVRPPCGRCPAGAAWSQARRSLEPCRDRVPARRR